MSINIFKSIFFKKMSNKINIGENILTSLISSIIYYANSKKYEKSIQLGIIEFGSSFVFDSIAENIEKKILFSSLTTGIVFSDISDQKNYNSDFLYGVGISSFTNLAVTTTINIFKE